MPRTALPATTPAAEDESATAQDAPQLATVTPIRPVLNTSADGPPSPGEAPAAEDDAGNDAEAVPTDPDSASAESGAGADSADDDFRGDR